MLGLGFILGTQKPQVLAPHPNSALRCPQPGGSSQSMHLASMQRLKALQSGRPHSARCAMVSRTASALSLIPRSSGGARRFGGPVRVALPPHPQILLACTATAVGITIQKERMSLIVQPRSCLVACIWQRLRRTKPIAAHCALGRAPQAQSRANAPGRMSGGGGSVRSMRGSTSSAAASRSACLPLACAAGPDAGGRCSHSSRIPSQAAACTPAAPASSPGDQRNRMVFSSTKKKCGMGCSRPRWLLAYSWRRPPPKLANHGLTTAMPTSCHSFTLHRGGSLSRHQCKSIYHGIY